ncbi:hypothetical protein MMC13_004944 [Lambiella insularis]|nr:hypothetical protein [Lambiella insularis]
MDASNGITASNGDTNAEEPQAPSSLSKYSAATQAIHADDYLNRVEDVAPPLHVATTFRYHDDPDQLNPATEESSSLSDRHVYSRHTAPTTTRLEALLTSLLHAPSLTYASGLAALHSAYIFLRPRRIAITAGYHGAHAVLALHCRLTGATLLPLDCPPAALGPGDVIHLETPLNPTGEALSIRHYAAKAHSRGAYLLVDGTFGPPGLQEPFALGADVVMHSGTKYLGGHSDMLCGVLATRREGWVRGLEKERAVMGNVMGGLEGWLGVRSLRTLEVRVRRQSASAGRLVAWLSGALAAEEESAEAEVVRAVVQRVQHASLQEADMAWLREQMPHGFGPVFALSLRSELLARRLPSKLALFHHATSLGGVESLIEWRKMSDTTVDTRLLRVSVGLEGWEDLRADLMAGFRALWEEEKGEEKEERGAREGDGGGIAG